MAAVRASYLAVYNVAQFLGWSAALSQTVVALTRAPSSVYAAAGPTVRERPSPCLAALAARSLFRTSSDELGGKQDWLGSTYQQPRMSALTPAAARAPGLCQGLALLETVHTSAGTRRPLAQPGPLR